MDRDDGVADSSEEPASDVVYDEDELKIEFSSSSSTTDAARLLLLRVLCSWGRVPTDCIGSGLVCALLAIS